MISAGVRPAGEDSCAATIADVPSTELRKRLVTFLHRFAGLPEHSVAGEYAKAISDPLQAMEVVWQTSQ